MHIQFISTGGTIDKVYFDSLSDYQIGPPQVRTILEQMNPAFTYEIHPLCAKDSLDLTEEDRASLRRMIEQMDARHIVVTHGTDTMTESASVLQGLDKTIVFTGAMQPARFHQTDAIFNIGCAVAAAQCLPPGTYIAMNGAIHDPLKVRKNRELGRFEAV